MHESEYVGFWSDAQKFIHGIRDCTLKVLVCHIRAGVISLVNRVCKSAGESGMLASERRKMHSKNASQAPAETLHDTLRLQGTQAVLALCVVVRAQFCREPCEKMMNIYIANCTIMSYLLGICRFTPPLLIFMKFSKHSGENSDVKNHQIFRGWRE